MEMENKISLLAFDLDGTLLDSTGDISRATLARIHKAMERGIRVTISSGRTPPMQQVFVSLLGFRGPYIACNGALILDSRDNSVLHSRPLENAELARLCEFSRQERFHICIQNRDALYYSKGNPRVSLLQQYNGVASKHGFPEVPIRFIEDDPGILARPAYKVLIYTPEPKQHQRLAAYLNKCSGLAYTFSEPNLFEISPPGVTKGEGIELICRHYKIPLGEVCAFGDYDNDIPIFERVGTGIAMGNACAALKSVAALVTDTNDNDGIGKALAAMGI